MNRLISDPFTRRTAQVLMALIFIGIGLVPIALLLVIALKATGGLVGGWSDFGQALMNVVALPLQDSVAQISTVFVSTFPVVVAAVCYVIDASEKPAKAGSTLNPIGKASVIVLLIGAVASAIALLTFNASMGLVETINQSETQALLVKGVVGGILSFQVLYIVRLLGLENSNAQ